MQPTSSSTSPSLSVLLCVRTMNWLVFCVHCSQNCLRFSIDKNSFSIINNKWIPRGILNSQYWAGPVASTATKHGIYKFSINSGKLFRWSLSLPFALPLHCIGISHYRRQRGMRIGRCFCCFLNRMCQSKKFNDSQLKTTSKFVTYIFGNKRLKRAQMIPSSVAA